MSRLKAILNLPEVKNGVLGDRSGTLLEHSNVENAESISAVMGYFASLMDQCGDSLGLSELSKATISGKNLSCLLLAESNNLGTLYLDSSSSQHEFEKVVDAMKRSTTKNRLGGSK